MLCRLRSRQQAAKEGNENELGFHGSHLVFGTPAVANLAAFRRLARFYHSAIRSEVENELLIRRN